MLESPFCGHTFTEQELNSVETVTCACGKNYRTREILEYNRLNAIIKTTNTEIGSLVRSMAAFNTGVAQANAAVTPVVTPPAPVKPPKPKRERPKLSVTQWLIVTAGFMILVAASIFVTQNLNSWNVWGWSTLEASLGIITGFGAFKLKRFSVLLTNFLAVFSSAMLLTLIMSISTQFGFGFQDWDKEPSWFWSVNLGIVATVSLLLAAKSKNFGWRAMAPLSISASAIVLVFGAGNFEDKWRTTVLSIALFITLIFVRLARNAADEVPKKSKDASYLADLHQREDQALKRFGIAIAIFLAGYAGITALQSILFSGTSPLDGLATIVLAMVWLAGARLKNTWVTSITENEPLILNLRNAASAVGISALGLGVISLAKPLGPELDLTVALAMIALVISLERFVKALLLPKISVTIAIWLNLALATLWNLGLADQTSAQEQLRTGWFFAAAAVILIGREWFELRLTRAMAALALGIVGPLLMLWNFRSTGDSTSILFAVVLGLCLVLVNLYPVAISFIAKRQKATSPNWLEIAPLVSSPLAILVGATVTTSDTPWAPLVLSVGYLVTALAGSHLTTKRSQKLSTALERQSYFALLLQLIVVVPSIVIYNIELLRQEVLITSGSALLVLGFAFLTRKLPIAYIGYILVSANVVFANDLWSDNPNLVLITILAILVGGLANLALLWLSNAKSPDSGAASIVTKITTALSIGVMSTAGGFELMHKTDSRWTLLATLLAIAIVVEFKSKSTMAFVYAAMAYFLALGEMTVVANAGDLAPTQQYLQLIVSGSVLLLLLIRSTLRTSHGALVGLSQLMAGAVGYHLALLLIEVTKTTWQGPEIYSLSIASMMAITALVTRSAMTNYKNYLVVDLPVAVATVPSIVYGVGADFWTNENQVRFLLASAVIWGHNLWRHNMAKSGIWLAFSYVTATVTGFAIASNLLHWTKVDWNGPEFYSFASAVTALVVGLQIDRSNKSRDNAIIDIPLFIAAVPSLLYGIANFGSDDVENSTRFLLAASAIWAENIWRTNKRKSGGWLIATIASGLFFAWAASREVLALTKLDYEGPEIYSVFITVSLLVAIRLGQQQDLFKSSVFATGVPMATFLTPSVVYTWNSVTQPFESLTGTEITRTVIALVLAIGALIYGIRGGNKGAYLVGTFELWLLAVPALWFKTSLVADGSATGEFRGLLVAGLIFWAIALLRSYNIIKGKSLVYLGIPVSIALAPALVNTLGALGGSELRTVDWWRFSIVLTASLALLILGSLRELGGTFFPGLIGVIVSVLPYGFHPISNKQWFLWIILLGVAALLVWLAVRLENMRKNGREPSAWLKELK